MMYSHVFKRYFPVRRGTDLVMLDETERQQMGKCIRSLPKLIQAWSIEELRKIKIEKTDDFSWWSISMAELRKECARLYAKIMAGHVLSEEEVKEVNLAVYAKKYNCLLEFLIPPRSHLERMYWFTRKESTLGG